MKKLIRVTTVPISLKVLLKGQLKFMSNYFEVVGISSGGKELEDVAQQEGITTRVVNMTRSITPLQDLRAVLSLYIIFKNEKPFIVHSHTPKAGTLSMIAAKLAGVKHRIHTVAGLPLLETKGGKRKLLNAVEKSTYRAAKKILVNSENLKSIILSEKFTSEDKLKVIGHGSSNGVDTAYFHPEIITEVEQYKFKQQLGISKDDFVFIYLGRLVSDKGVNEMVTAFSNLSQNQKQLKLLLLGNREDELNPLLPKTEDKIKTNTSILSLGFVDDVRPYLAISNALVLASYREGFPNVVMQAGAMGKASIVSDINGCNEIVSHKRTGVIVPVKNSSAIEKAMEYLKNNPEKCRTLGQAARKRVKENYSQKFVWDGLLKFYQSLI